MAKTTLETFDLYTYKGSLAMHEQEGGYEAPDVEINGQSVLYQLWSALELNYGYTDGITCFIEAPGIWKITVERIA